MGGLCQPNVDTSEGFTNVVGGTQLPSWVSKEGQQIFGQASALAQRPLDIYNQPRVAGFNPDQVAGFAQTWGNQGAYRPGLTDASRRFGENEINVQPDGSIGGQYGNPFQSAVTQRAVDEIGRTGLIRQVGNDAVAAQASAFGGARHGILNAETDRNTQLAQGDAYLKGNLANFQQAQSQFNADSNRIAQIAPQLSSLGYQDAAALANIGGAQQQLMQTNMDTAYGDFIEQRENPYRMTNFALGTLQGTPYETQTFSNTTSVTPQLSTSPFGQVAGALTGLYGASKLIGTP